MKPDKYDILSFPDDGKTVVPLYEIVTLGIQTLVIPNEYNPNQVMSAYLQRLGSNRQLESLEDFQKAAFHHELYECGHRHVYDPGKAGTF
jgi:hypothetical protein